MGWLSQKYLCDEWSEILHKNKDKKLICFSAGTAMYTVEGLLPEGMHIAYYIDGNYKKWQNNILNVTVKHTDEIRKEKKGEFFVLIGGQHTISMKEELLGYGLVEGEDFYNAYRYNEKAMRLAKAEYQSENMIRFIQQNIDTDIAAFKVCSSRKKYGVIMTHTFLEPAAFDIALYLLLKYNGCDVDLIVDDIYSAENASIYEGITQDMKVVDGRIVDVLKEKIPDVSVKYLSDYKKSKLNHYELEVLAEATRMSAVWQRSRNNERIMSKNVDEWYNSFYSILHNNFEYIKAFFEENQYDVMTVLSGIHQQRYFYTYMAQCKGIRLATYDSASERPVWSADGACSRANDIYHIVKNGMFSDDEKEKISILAQKIMSERINHVSDGMETLNYQKGERKKVTENWFDVIIPLNVMWDAAALGMSRVFEDEKKWLEETVAYIIEHTDANILIRKHPSNRMHNIYNVDSITDTIERKYLEEDRVLVISEAHELNTYEYIEHCKLVLPFTTTLGVEAALMGKKVITCTKVYYDKMSFVESAQDKNDYFTKIQYWLKNEFAGCGDLSEAYIAFLLVMNKGIESDKAFFKDTDPRWMFSNFQELIYREDVTDIVNCITKNIPIDYVNLKRLIIRSFHVDNDLGKCHSERC